jgi:predicted nuclease of predicted toxin-antitoxin system
MRLLMNENITRTVIEELRRRGHDVLSVKESMCAEQDEVILTHAQAEQRIVVTQDKDFGELAFRSQLPASCGVILFRLSGTNPDHDNQRMVEVLEGRTDWVGHFSVVTDDRVRMRALPEVPPPRSAKPRKRKK